MQRRVQDTVGLRVLYVMYVVLQLREHKNCLPKCQCRHNKAAFDMLKLQVPTLSTQSSAPDSSSAPPQNTADGLRPQSHTPLIGEWLVSGW